MHITATRFRPQTSPRPSHERWKALHISCEGPDGKGKQCPEKKNAVALCLVFQGWFVLQYTLTYDVCQGQMTSELFMAFKYETIPDKILELVTSKVDIKEILKMRYVAYDFSTRICWIYRLEGWLFNTSFAFRVDSLLHSPNPPSLHTHIKSLLHTVS